MRSDGDMKRDVEDEIRYDSNAESTDIAVSVNGGVLTLTGSVPSYRQKLHIETLAKRISGRMRVANEIQVRVGASDSRSDAEIACDLIANLNEELPFSCGPHIKSVVKDGWITLAGEFEWNYQLLRASGCARRVNGVAGIKECINFAARASAAEINARIKDASMLGAQRELRSWAQGDEQPQRGANQ
jgi:osmotically-inducible protein OsmY